MGQRKQVHLFQDEPVSWWSHPLLMSDERNSLCRGFYLLFGALLLAGSVPAGWASRASHRDGRKEGWFLQTS